MFFKTQNAGLQAQTSYAICLVWDLSVFAPKNFQVGADAAGSENTLGIMCLRRRGNFYQIQVKFNELLCITTRFILFRSVFPLNIIQFVPRNRIILKYLLFWRSFGDPAFTELVAPYF